MKKGTTLKILGLIVLLALSNFAFSQKKSDNSSNLKSKIARKSGKSIQSNTAFYPSGVELNRKSEQNIHTSMVNVGESIEMDVVSTSLTKQTILPVVADSQTLLVRPYSIVGYMNSNGNKQDISQEDSTTILEYVINANGDLLNVKGNNDYIKALTNSGINNIQKGLNLMVYLKHKSELFLNDSFTIEHEGKPYSYKKTFVLSEINEKEAIFTTHQTITLDHNYDMNNYDIHQLASGFSNGTMKVRLSDNLVTYNEENLSLSGYMEMVSVNIPLTIKGTMKESITNN